jgi:hypothetical protein
MNTPNKTQTQAQEQQALVGIDKHFPAGTTLTFKGVSVTPASMKADLSADLAAAAATTTAKAAVTVAVKNEQLTRAKARQTLTLLRDYILLTAGNDAAAILQDCGLTAPKTPVKTVKVKAKAVLRGAQTRVLRHTMTKAERKAIQAPPVTDIEATALALPPAPPAKP